MLIEVFGYLNSSTNFQHELLYGAAFLLMASDFFFRNEQKQKKNYLIGARSLCVRARDNWIIWLLSLFIWNECTKMSANGLSKYYCFNDSLANETWKTFGIISFKSDVTFLVFYIKRLSTYPNSIDGKSMQTRIAFRICEIITKRHNITCLWMSPNGQITLDIW